MLRRRDGPRWSTVLSRVSVTRHGRRASVRSKGAWAGISRTGLTTGLTSSAGTKRQAQTYILAAQNRNYSVKYVFGIFRMDLFHCVSTQKLNGSVKTIERAKSEDKEPVAPPRGARRTSLPAHSNKKLSK